MGQLMEKKKGFPIIRTKIMIPALRPGIIHRPHLIQRIENGIEQGFVLISAPPGYGKTTLVADWAHGKKTPVFWLTLDEQDNDELTLKRYFWAMANEETSSGQAEPAVFSIHDHSGEGIHSLLISLINGCVESDTEFSLVLDDYQTIQNPEIHREILFLLDHFPAHFRLVIITRSDPPFPLAHLHAVNRVTEIRAADLNFSRAEAGEFLSQTIPLELSGAEIQQTYEQTEGWITGLQLKAISLNEIHAVRLEGAALSSNPRLTMEYMIDEVLYRQSPDVQDFLIRTSILDNLNGHLCDFVINQDNPQLNSQELLHSLYHSNIFLIPLDQEELWFRYHPLFSQALRNLLLEKHPTEVPVLYSRASQWCDQNGMFEEALAYSSHADDKQQYLTLVEKYSIFAVNKGNILDTLAWIKRTDQNLIETSPLLCLIYAWGLMIRFELNLSEYWLEKTRDLLANEPVSKVLLPYKNDLLGLVFAAQSMLSIMRGDIEQALVFSTQALQILPEENSFSHCFALLNQGLTLAMNGNLDQAIEVYEETILISQRSGNWITLMISRSNLAEVLIDKGKLSRALILFQQSLKYLPSSETSSGFKGYLYKEIGEVYLIRNQLKEAGKFLMQGVDLSRDWLPSINQLDTHIRLANYYHCQGDYINSKNEINLAREIADVSQGQMDDLIIDISEIKLSLLRGQTSQAINWVQRMKLTGDDYPTVLGKMPVALSVPTGLLLARLSFVLGRQGNDHSQIERVEKILLPILPDLEKMGQVSYSLEGWMLVALAYHELNRLTEMFAILEKVFRIAEPEEIRQVFINEGIPMSRLITRYLAHIKQNPPADGIPSRAFLSDLLYRMSNRNDEQIPASAEIVDEGVEKPISPDMLTQREIEVMTLVASGQTNGEIAGRLHLSINTVKRHLNNIFLKLGVATRTQAILVARKQGWIR
jgi:LuxR family maltose regulon positive regulatory protein